MKLMLDVDIKLPAQKINYIDNIFLIGSCFTEHIGKRLEELKFPVLQNPNGILFDPISVTQSLNSYICAAVGVIHQQLFEIVEPEARFIL